MKECLDIELTLLRGDVLCFLGSVEVVSCEVEPEGNVWG
jgi:hypothetical protein